MPSRAQRAAIAASTVEACHIGGYTLTDGTRVNFGQELAMAAAATRLFEVDDPVPRNAKPSEYSPSRVELSDEGVMDACARLSRSESHVGCLNFASARNPGGGFLRGSLAQEEAICLVSGLYHCLLTAPEYYQAHNRARDPLYSHRLIWSPHVPVLRTLEGGWLEPGPSLVSFVTSAAVNAGVCRTRGVSESRICKEMTERVERVLAIAAANGVEHLVLGAWGCGVFRMVPAVVATIFAEALKSPRFRGAFRRVVFAIKGRDTNYAEFALAFRAAKLPFVEYAHQHAARLGVDATLPQLTAKALAAPASAMASKVAANAPAAPASATASKVELQLRAMLDVDVACEQLQRGGRWEASVASVATGEVLATETSSKRGRARRSAMQRAIEVLTLRVDAVGPPLAAQASPRQGFDFFAVLDFEATCDDRAPPAPQEIVEVPVVLLDAATLDVVAEFHRYVKPTHHPILTAFCHELTGIEQATVDAGGEFRAVLGELECFLASHGLVSSDGGAAPRTFAFVTCGDWDLRRMLPLQCRTSGVGVPRWARQWINVKVEASRALSPFRAKGMLGMLDKLGLPLEGRHHSGIDDSRNIARIARALCAEHGAVLQLSPRCLVRD